MNWKQRLALWTVIALAGYFLIKQPVQAADAVGGAFSAVGAAFGSVITFLTALFT